MTKYLSQSSDRNRNHDIPQQRGFPQSDYSIYTLLFSNCITIIFAILENWNYATLLWIYWGQSIIIGILNFVRILLLREFSTKNLTINKHPAKSDRATKRFIAVFFAFHYGMFHFGYLIFMLVSPGQQQVDRLFFLTCIALFALSHIWSFSATWRSDREHPPAIGRLMFWPYLRIIPMHLTVMIGFHYFKNQSLLVFFLTLKTITDVLAHWLNSRLSAGNWPSDKKATLA